MTVHIVIEDDIDPYCGYYVIGVFSSREKALQFMSTDKRELEIIERELDKVIT